MTIDGQIILVTSNPVELLEDYKSECDNFKYKFKDFILSKEIIKVVKL